VSPLLMSVIVFACVSGGAFLGMFLRNRLPEQHLSGATKDAVRLGSGLIGTIADVLAARSVPFVFSTGYDKDTLLDGYRIFPVLQKPFHRSQLSVVLAKLLTPKEPSVESMIAAIAETSP